MPNSKYTIISNTAIDPGSVDENKKSPGIVSGLLTGASVLSLLQVVVCCWQMLFPVKKCSKCEKNMAKRATKRITKRLRVASEGKATEAIATSITNDNNHRTTPEQSSHF